VQRIDSVVGRCKNCRDVVTTKVCEPTVQTCQPHSAAPGVLARVTLQTNDPKKRWSGVGLMLVLRRLYPFLMCSVQCCLQGMK
jgi:hypothetical protein